VIFVTVNKPPAGHPVSESRGPVVSVHSLLQKLIEIEQSIGVETDTTLRKQVLDAQDYLLQMQKEIVENLRYRPRRFMPETEFTSTYAA
jgi:hypothetical protein